MDDPDLTHIDPTNRVGTKKSAGRDGLAAVAIILLTIALIVFVVSSLI